MIETEIYEDEPTGLPQETSGTDVIESCTNTALDHFIEGKNAGMGPILNAPGLAMFFAEDAVMECEYPTEDGMKQRTMRGQAEIQAFFEELAKMMVSLFYAETNRAITGRNATWTGKVTGVHGPSRVPVEMDAIFKLEFDDHDHVVHEWCRLTLVSLG